MASIFFSISSGKLEIVKVLHKTRTRDKLEAIRLFRAETILRIPNQTSTIGGEITRSIHYGRSTKTKRKITLPSNIVCQHLCLFRMLKPFSIIDLEK